MSIDWLSEKDRKALEALHDLKDAMSDPSGKELAEKDEVLRLRGYAAGLRIYLHAVLKAIIILSPQRQLTHEIFVYAAKECRTTCGNALAKSTEDDTPNPLLSGTMQFFEETVESLSNLPKTS